MTEQTLPGGGTAVAEPPAPVLPMDGADDHSDNGRRRKLMIVGAAAGVLVLAIAAFFLTRGGGSPSNDAFVAPHHAATQPAKAHHHKAAVNKPVTLPKKYKGHVGRDPFNPLYTAPVAAAASGTTTTTNPDGSTTTTTTPDGSTTTTSGGTPTTTTHQRVYRPIWLQLNSFSPREAKFTVGYSNGKTLRAVRFTVNAPTGNSSTVFAKTFALLKISQGQVFVQFGDGTPFVLDAQHNTMIVN
jgi:hypothetical protein